jgi:hypothetical protein
MQRIQVSKNFFLDEFVPPSTYFNLPCNGLSVMDQKVFAITQLLRELYGKPIGVNNWWGYYKENELDVPVEQIIEDIETSANLYWKGKSQTVYKWSGYRPPHCKIGAPASAHKRAKAADPKGSEKEFMQIVRNNAKRFYDLGLRRVEDVSITPGWLHMDSHEHNTLPFHINVVGLKTVVERIKV